MTEILAAFLERHRLSVELEAERAHRGHDEHLQLLGQVASSVAHDFNNLLTAIIGYGDLLELELTQGASGRAELREIREAANRATHLVDEVLSFGRPRPSG
ncbi:MAG: histidine kinase dimerization/phospho-acceptor domain-containing protein, partial [Myxococcota bacterium]